jgi:hypothetical protein
MTIGDIICHKSLYNQPVLSIKIYSHYFKNLVKDKHSKKIRLYLFNTDNIYYVRYKSKKKWLCLEFKDMGSVINYVISLYNTVASKSYNRTSNILFSIISINSNLKKRGTILSDLCDSITPEHNNVTEVIKQKLKLYFNIINSLQLRGNFPL